MRVGEAGGATKIIEEIIFFILTPKHMATSVLWFKLLSFYVGIKYDFLCINMREVLKNAHC